MCAPNAFKREDEQMHNNQKWRPQNCGPDREVIVQMMRNSVLRCENFAVRSYAALREGGVAPPSIQFQIEGRGESKASAHRRNIQRRHHAPRDLRWEE